MIAKTQNLFKRLVHSMFLTLLLFLQFNGFAFAEDNLPGDVVLNHSSGDDEIDRIRREIRTHPTDESNYVYRGAMARLWAAALGHQGAVTGGRFSPVSIRTKRIASIQNKKERKQKLPDTGS